MTLTTVLKMLKSVPGVNAEKLGFVGHSEGALIAAIAASESKEVKFTVMLGGPALPGKLILQEQGALIAEAEGEKEGSSEDEIERSKRFSADILKHAIGKKENLNERKATIKKITEDYYNSLTEKDQKTVGDLNTFHKTLESAYFSPWMQAFIKMNPQTYLERIPCPTLSLHGEVDLQVPSKSNVPAMKAALAYFSAVKLGFLASTER